HISIPPLLRDFPCNRERRSLHSYPTRRSSDLAAAVEGVDLGRLHVHAGDGVSQLRETAGGDRAHVTQTENADIHRADHGTGARGDRKSTRLNSSHVKISYAVFCLKKKTRIRPP